jgi:hypothetical protein
MAIQAIKEVALPLYEGRMIGQFDFSQKGWVSGKGRTAVWRDIPWEAKQIEPQYLISQSIAIDSLHPRIAFMDITSGTNMRTMISAYLNGLPCGNSAPVLASSVDSHALVAVLNSFTYDMACRARCTGLHLNWFIVEETYTVLPKLCLVLRGVAERLTLSHPVQFSSLSNPIRIGLRTGERLRLRCILDAAVAHLYGLDQGDFRWIMRDCDHPVAQSSNIAFTRALDGKGFWRVEKAAPPELRHTVLAQVAFDDLQALIAKYGEEEGMNQFLGSGSPVPPGEGAGGEGHEGWMLPETLRLADFNLGHDDRAQKPQPVAAALGPRFYDWQLKQTPEQAWAETQRHAENLRRIRSIGVTDLEAGDPDPSTEKLQSQTKASRPGTLDLFSST